MEKDNIKNIFLKYLKDNDHRITKERIIVLNFALGMHIHFDADELYKKINDNLTKVSRATVYNTLELMSECNIISKQNFKGDRNRFEKKYGRNKHFHLICSDLDKIIEVENKKVDKIITDMCKKRNFRLIDYSLQVFVECEKK